jgi:serine/threonine protein kinase
LKAFAMGFEARDRTEVPGLEGTPYRFVREIGHGGMGSVHEVEHRALGKIFVMKVLHESLAHRDDFALRMKREWRTLARLEHPAIVRVTDAGQTAEGLPFFVMERLEGQTLGEALRARGRFGAAEAIRLVSVVLSGLEVAHRAGAIHRDIKPQNLFLTAEGPKILDFGIAKSMRRGGAFVTRSGVAIGTPRYMAPEQAAGLPVDGRADVYACGLVLFEMIAGQDPFSHLKDQAALVNAQVSEVPVRLDDVCSAPEALGDLLARFLAKDPADRPFSARLAQLELSALLPLVESDQPGRTPSVVPASLSRVRQDDESTAGNSGLSSSLPPSASFEFSPARPPVGAPAAPTPIEAAPTGDARLEPEVRKSPSVTPPPLARAGREAEQSARATKRSGRPWAIAAFFLLTSSVLGLAALVLRPAWLEEAGYWVDGRGGDAARGQSSFDFPDTPPDPAVLGAPAPPVTPAPAQGPGAEALSARDDARTLGASAPPKTEVSGSALVSPRPSGAAAAPPTQGHPPEDEARDARAPEGMPPSTAVRRAQNPGGRTTQPAADQGLKRADPSAAEAGPEGLPGSGLW